MNKKEILNYLKKLDLDKNEYIVISGASLVLHDVIDATKDIDLSCSKKYYDRIKWPTKMGHMGKEIKYSDAKKDAFIGYIPGKDYLNECNNELKNIFDLDS